MAPTAAARARERAAPCRPTSRVPSVWLERSVDGRGSIECTLVTVIADTAWLCSVVCAGRR